MLMVTKNKITIIALLAGGSFLATVPRLEAQQVRVEAFDRALVERLVRALESQAHATEALTRATERCK